MENRLNNRRKFALVVCGLVIAGFVAQYVRALVANVPKLRVGPLVTTEEARDSLRLFVLGDTGSGSANQKAVAAAMEARCEQAKPDGIVLLGDNFYMVGVESIDDPQWHTKVFDMYGGPCLGKVPIYPVLGNHDYRGNPTAQIEMTQTNPRWRMPNRFWAVDFGYLVKLIGFDSQTSEFCFHSRFCAVDFLLDQARKPTTVWTLVAAHHPLDSASERGHGHSGGARGLFLKPALCDYVDAYLSGHAHHLEHRTVDGCRLELFISGGGGGDLYKVVETDDPAVKFVKSAYGYLEVEATKERLVTRFHGTDGAVLYEASKVSEE